MEISKQEIMTIVSNILTKNEIKVSYENNVCIIYRNTAFGWKPVIFIDNKDEEIVEIEGVKYRL